MKRLQTLTASVLATIALLFAPVLALAAPYWEVSISTPASQRSHSFMVEYTVLSTESDSFTVNLIRDGVGVAAPAQNTSSDPDAINGNSGSFAVTVPTDGDYSYHVEATRDGSADGVKATASRTVHVDATAPDAPKYNGKTNAGNSYVISFTAPSSPDVTHVQIFAATSTTYQASDATRVGDVAVSPGQSTSFSYTAPSSTVRYFAVQAFDAAGNGSTIVGDPGITVTNVRTTSTPNSGVNTAVATPGAFGTAGTANNPAAANAANGSVLSATTTAPGGEVNATGNSKTTTPANKGKVLGTEITKPSSSQTGQWTVGVLALIAGAAAYYVFQRRRSVRKP